MNWIIGIAITILVGLILLGGVKRIGQVTERLVPFMAVFYIVLALGVVVFHFQNIPAVFASIFEGAFHPSAVTGGVDVYKRQSVLQELRFIQRCRHILQQKAEHLTQHLM